MIDEVVKEFLVESYENLDLLESEFVALEKDPSTETLGSIFRAIHTIKGTCGFLGFPKLESVAHAGENLLSLLRDGELRINPEFTSALLALVDAVRGMLGTIETTGSDGDGDYTELLEILNRLQMGVEAPKAPAEEGEKHEAHDSEEDLPEPEPPQAQTTDDHPEPASSLVEESGSPAQVDESVQEIEQGSGEEQPRGEKETIAHNQQAQEVQEVVDANPSQKESRGSGISDSTVRVDVGLLDKLMNLVGELVLSRNQILQFAGSQESTAVLASAQHLNLVTAELQEGVMKTRMQPIGNIWNKFPRVVRDLAGFCGKHVQVEMEGAETELDRTIIEAIKDPLTHLVRNCVDHGIEKPEVRSACGKPVEGRIFLRAYHEGGQVNIEISDDGGGMDPERFKDKALKMGLVTQEQASRMGEREFVSLIFLPGFSTAAKVTHVSGRGVGMDVVKTNIEKIGGTIDVHSRPGKGTIFKTKIPLTLAIIPALMVDCVSDRYAIPQVSLLELVRLEGKRAKKGVEMVHGAPVYRLRGNLLPLVYLDKELRVKDTSGDKSDDTGENLINIVVLQADDRQFGLVVDGISDSKDIVVKPLGKHLQGITAFSGATILGDGKVALILDVLGLAQQANVVCETRDRSLADSAAKSQAQEQELQTFLIFRNGEDNRMAIPLSLVARLEEFPLSSIEKSGSQEVVQYRGKIMPLIRLSDVLGGGSFSGTKNQDEEEYVQVVVYSEQGQSAGLIVEQILDIVEDEVKVRREDRSRGRLGSAVIQGRVTDLLDVRSIISDVDPNFFDQPVAA